MTGKNKCEVLKKVRDVIAEQNGIDYKSTECSFKGECKGTCPKCEAELGFLTSEVKKLKSSGKRIAVAGIAAAIVATSAAGCAPHQNNDTAEPSSENTEVITELDGDVVYLPEDIGEVAEGSTVTGIVAAEDCTTEDSAAYIPSENAK